MSLPRSKIPVHAILWATLVALLDPSARLSAADIQITKIGKWPGYPNGHYFLRESLPLVGPSAQDIGALESLLACLARMKHMNPRPASLAYEVSLNGMNYRSSFDGWTPFNPDDLAPGCVDLLTVYETNIRPVNVAAQDSDPEEAADLLERLMRMANSRPGFPGTSNPDPLLLGARPVQLHRPPGSVTWHQEERASLEIPRSTSAPTEMSRVRWTQR